MTDTNRDRSLGEAAGASRRGTEQQESQKKKHASRTEGTNRDFDESEESANQAHGHPREEREQGTE
jgi:hypothetical protein